MTTVSQSLRHPSLATLARKEIANYLRHKLYWVGTGLLAAVSVVGLVGPDDQWSTTGDGLAPAALLGVLGIVVMAGLTRNSDRAAEAAGTISVDQGTRTLALASAVVVPFATGLLWYVAAVVGYQLHPPAASAVPFGDVTDTFVYANMFEQGVMSTLGGPILGLVIARWWPRRWVAPVAAVVIVLVTMVMQPLFDWAASWRHVWVWIHFVAPHGVEGDADRAVQLSGSPYFYIAYLLSLCVLGVLVALYKDPEGDRARLRTQIVVVAALAAALCLFAMVVGPEGIVANPLPSPSAAP
jgi:hypothetical protein